MNKSSLSFGRFIGKICKETTFRDFSFSNVLDRVDDEVEMHTHQDAHFLLVVDGIYTTTARNVDSLCPASTLIFNPPGTTHRDHFHTRGGRFFTVSVKPEAMDRLQAGIPLVDYSVGFSSGEIIWLASRLYREAQNTDRASQIVMEGMALELLGLTLRHRMGADRVRPRWLDRAHELIRDRFREDLSVSEIAKTVGVHQIYLARAFRKHFDKSIGEFIRDLRIEFAARQIANSKESLSQIALLAGFYDQSHFCRTFKQVTGFTPTEHQQNFTS